MARCKNLTLILMEAGMPATHAAFVTKTLDRLRLNALGSEDYAELLYGWREDAVRYERWLAGELYKKYGCDSPTRTLFDPLMQPASRGTEG